MRSEAMMSPSDQQELSNRSAQHLQRVEVLVQALEIPRGSFDAFHPIETLGQLWGTVCSRIPSDRPDKVRPIMGKHCVTVQGRWTPRRGCPKSDCAGQHRDSTDRPRNRVASKASAAKTVSSSRIQAYNLENDKFARKLPRIHWASDGINILPAERPGRGERKLKGLRCCDGALPARTLPARP